MALFRYGLIADLVNLPPGTPGIGARLRAKAGKDYVIPGTARTRVATETMRHWLTLHRQGGFVVGVDVHGDYDPMATFYKSEVERLIVDTRAILDEFERADRRERRSFAALVLFRARN